MAFSIGGGKGRVRADINITPLVDVVLVLLIIFMVMTPILLKQLPIEVPEKVESLDQVPPQDQIVVSVLADGSIELNKERITRDDLPLKVKDVLLERRDKILFFDVDDAANYGEVVAVMDVCKGAGAKVLGLMTK